MITDCNMPIMNGYELSRSIREYEQREQLVPCVVLGFTANAQPEERQRCVQAGMDDCLFKPISLTVLERQLAHIVPKAVHQRLDLQCLEALTGGDPHLSRRLLEELLSSSHQDRQILSELLDRHAPLSKSLSKPTRSRAQPVSCKPIHWRGNAKPWSKAVRAMRSGP